MKYTRIYADAKGETHLQDVEPEMKEAGNASTMSDLVAAKGVIFRDTSSEEYFIDWHNAPRRQFVVNLTGEVEITGQRRRKAPLRARLDPARGRCHRKRSHLARRG